MYLDFERWVTYTFGSLQIWWVHSQLHPRCLCVHRGILLESVFFVRISMAGWILTLLPWVTKLLRKQSFLHISYIFHMFFRCMIAIFRAPPILYHLLVSHRIHVSNFLSLPSNSTIYHSWILWVKDVSFNSSQGNLPVYDFWAVGPRDQTIRRARWGKLFPIWASTTNWIRVYRSTRFCG